MLVLWDTTYATRHGARKNVSNAGHVVSRSPSRRPETPRKGANESGARFRAVMKHTWIF